MGIKTESLTKKKVKNIFIRTFLFVIIVFLISGYLDLFESAVDFVHRHENLELDEIFVVAIFAVVWLSVEQLILVRHIYKSSKKYEDISMIDELTGLYNRRGFFIRVEEMLRDLSVSEGKGVLLYFDIDKFKEINDVYGHHAGDEVLIKFSNILLQLNSEKVISGRIGGDEFVVFLIDDNDSCINEYLKNINNELIALEKFKNYGLKISMGQANYPSDGSAIDQLLSQADKKMYIEKNTESKKNYRG